MKPRVSTGSSIKLAPQFNCIFKNVWYFFFLLGGSEVLECKRFPILCVISCELIFHTDPLLLVTPVMINMWPWHTHAYWTSSVHSRHCGISVWHFWLFNDHSGSQRCHNKAEHSLKFIKCFVDAVHFKGPTVQIEHVGGSVLLFCHVVTQEKC